MDQQQLAMLDMYGPPQPMPGIGNNPGLGRPPVSSTDPVNVPVPGSPILPDSVPDHKPEKGKGRGK